MQNSKENSIQCLFSPEGKKLSELLEESFRLFLHRILSETTGEES